MRAAFSISPPTKTAEAAVTGSGQGRQASRVRNDRRSWVIGQPGLRPDGGPRGARCRDRRAPRDGRGPVRARRGAGAPPRPDGSSSGKPPSSDGLSKPTAEESRERGKSRRRESSRKPGGQRGHRGGTLARSDVPDRAGDHYPATCAGCGGALDAGTSVGSAARQVHDLPEPPPPGVTERRAHRCVCPARGAATRGSRPCRPLS